MNTASPSSARGAVLAGFASIYLIWGTTYLAIAFAIATIPPFVSGATRYLLSAALMFAWLRSRNVQPLSGVPIVPALLCGVLLSGMGNGFVIWAQQGLPTGITALLVAATPVCIGVLDWAFFSHRRPTAQALTGIAVGFLGVLIIVVHTTSLTGSIHPMHLFAMLASVCAWSTGTLLQQRRANPTTVLSFGCVQMFGGGLFQLILASLDGEWQQLDFDAISATSVVSVLYLIVFGNLIATNAYLWLLTQVAAQKVTTYTLVNPLIALLLGAVVLHEQLTFHTAIAAALVLGGVGLVLFRNLVPRMSWHKQPPDRIAEQRG
jgi:drug/metabolite transporter (DMT)-like permease